LRFLVIASRYLAGVVLALRRIQDEDESLAQRQATEVIEGWATDLIKVVGKFGKNLTQDPDSIYRLIPPFCPSPSMVYQQFGSKESRVLQVSGTATAKWDDCLARFSFDPGAMASSVLDAGSRLVILTIVRRTSTIITYSDSTFEELRRMEHPERVLMIQANKLGTLLMSYGYKTTRIWNLATGECIKVVDNPTGRPRPQTAMFVNDQVLVGNEDRRIRSVLISASEDLDPCSGWEVKSHVEEQAQVWEGTIANAPTCSAISHDGRMVAYGYRQHPVTVWELEPTMFRNQIDVGADTDLMEVSSLKWHPLRPEIFCLSSVGFLYRWDPVFDQASNMTSSGADTFCLNRNGSLVATGDAVGTIKVYASAGLSLLCQLSSQDTILNLSFSSDSRRLYDMRSMYGIVWEPNTLVRLAEKSEYPESNTDILGDSESLAKLSLHSEHTAARFGGVVSLARQPVGSLYCYGTEDGVALLGEVAKPDVGELTRSASYLSVEHVVWSEDGRLVVLSDLGGRLLFKRVTRSPDGWNVHHEHDLQIPTSQGHITQLVFHPSGDRLLVTTSGTLHSVDLRSWEVTNAPCPAALERQVKWTCHPTMPEYFLGFSSTEVRINSWANLCEIGAQVYLPPRTTTQDPVDSPPDAGSIPSRDRTFRRDCGRLGRLISGQQLPDILLETLHTAASGELKREFLIFEAADICISSTGDNDKASLRYTTLPDHVRSRIREPLTFLPRRRLAYLDVDRWICTYRLSTPPALSITRRSESSIPTISGGGTSSRDSEAASQRRLSLQRPAEGFGRGVVTRHGSDSASGNNNGIEKYYFLPGDWVMANEAHLCTMMSDGTLLCPQNGGIASVQSATLRR
jgi:WD40 repeat protein